MQAGKHRHSQHASNIVAATIDSLSTSMRHQRSVLVNSPKPAVISANSVCGIADVLQGSPRSEILNSTLLKVKRERAIKVFLKSEVGQNTALHGPPIARNSMFLVSVVPVHSITFLAASFSAEKVNACFIYCQEHYMYVFSSSSSFFIFLFFISLLILFFLFSSAASFSAIDIK